MKNGIATASENFLQDKGGPYLNYESTLASIRCVCTGARAFYERIASDSVGYLSLSFGVLNAQGVIMYEGQEKNSGGHRVTSLPDEVFRSETAVPVADFIADPVKAISPLVEEIVIGFNLQDKF
ncbi:MAG TPA: hypothetical protein VK395_20615 [Gemmataceae bacterium]|nr:hypothetical protein [Gemmataceae bacterium]